MVGPRVQEPCCRSGVPAMPCGDRPQGPSPVTTRITRILRISRWRTGTAW
ncbi:unnamed protein product [[Actinomadura] parvosata subsp. kistnae]|nr:unnamed protein product [Actinomadura parvosata subsp. kistnae]